MLMCLFTVAGRDKKLGKLIKTSVHSISSCAGHSAEAAALGELAQELDVNPTVAEPQKLYGLACSHSISAAGHQFRAGRWLNCKLRTLKRRRGCSEHT